MKGFEVIKNRFFLILFSNYLVSIPLFIMIKNKVNHKKQNH